MKKLFLSLIALFMLVPFTAMSEDGKVEDPIKRIHHHSQETATPAFTGRRGDNNLLCTRKSCWCRLQRIYRDCGGACNRSRRKNNIWRDSRNRSRHGLLFRFAQCQYDLYHTHCGSPLWRYRIHLFIAQYSRWLRWFWKIAERIRLHSLHHRPHKGRDASQHHGEADRASFAVGLSFPIR